MCARNVDRSDDHELFLEAVAGAEPLADRERRQLPAPAAKLVIAERTSSFQIDRDGGRVLGRNHGVSRSQVKKLAADCKPQAHIDLHRHTADEARARLSSFVCNASDDCILVITGKGGSVLKSVVESELSGPLADRVRAFSTAAGRDGGNGAYYVWLRVS